LPLLSIDKLGKRFRNGTEALGGVDLAVESGDFLSILGPSGCGKSTLLRLIAGLERPSAGEINWRERASLGFVFQEPTLMPWATVFDNVRLPLRLQGLPSTGVAETLDAVGLQGFERAYPRELSGGMKMRVSLARALVMKPRLLLLDEPFAALDEITRFKLNEDLLRLWRSEGFTVIFVTHSLFESAFLSRRVAVMSRRPGRITDELAIDFPGLRDRALRTSPAYGETCRLLSLRLEAAAA